MLRTRVTQLGEHLDEADEVMRCDPSPLLKKSDESVSLSGPGRVEVRPLTRPGNVGCLLDRDVFRRGLTALE